MAEAKQPPEDLDASKAEAMALLEEAEAEAAEAEAEAEAARARARVARLRRKALAEAEAAAEKQPANADKDADDTVESFDKETDTDSDEESSDETITAAEGQSGLATWRRRVRSLSLSLSVTSKVAAIILICAFAVAAGYMMWQVHDATGRAQREANFVAGARQGVINMFSLDFNRAKQDVQRVIDSSTGQFRDDFEQRAKDFASVVEQSKVVSQGTVRSAALESMNENSASVLILATSKITNAAGAQDEPRAFRLRVTVTEDGGQYKMSKVDFVV
jgi:Mce-associated membrane protein